jgi:adenine-specific DNA-methyltransferase
MAKRAKTKKPIEQYEHKDKKRVNNPPVGLVDASTDAPEKKKIYAYDPHLDPSLQWAGKAERSSFEVPTVSLHVHERIDPRTIIEAVRKRNGSSYEQISLFASPDENPPLREAIEFYKHAHNWSNRLIAGDSLLVMNSLLEKEGLAGQVQMIYFDPPYGIKYGSNFQPFTHGREVRDGNDEDLTAEPEMIRAFRDVWELGIHSYLTYMRDRLLLARDLLAEAGSIFVQISDENIHHVRELMDEIFGSNNFGSLITFQKTTGSTTRTVPRTCDFLLWYARDMTKLKYRKLYLAQVPGEVGAKEYKRVELADGSLQPAADFMENGRLRLPDGARLFATGDISSKGGDDPDILVEWVGKSYRLSCKPNRHWKAGVQGTRRLWEVGRLLRQEGLRIFKRYFGDFPYREITHTWTDTRGEEDPTYVVQTSTKVLERCVLMTTDPGDLVVDITCGSGTTAYVAEQWGRRWITCDTSRVATTLAKQRLMTSVFDYFQLAHQDEGVGSGFKYQTVPHVTLKSIANDEPPEQESLYDKPSADKGKVRVTGPFTVEAVPAPMVRAPGRVEGGNESEPQPGDASVSRTGVTLRHDEWRAELLRAGVRGKRGQMILFSRVEPLPGTRWLQAEAETKANEKGADVIREPGAATEALRVVVSFGPEHAPLEQRQVEVAIEEARKLVPRPQIVLFAAFQFDPEAAKDIDELNWPGVTVLKAQMNADLFTEDLKKKRSSNESFWLIGQPEVVLRKSKGKPEKKPSGSLWEVEVKGFDYYNTRTGQIESGGPKQIAVWMLDTDYNGRSLFPRQVFFPMAGEKEGWARLAKNLKAEIDESLIEAYRGTVSLPFEAGANGRIAVKIVDDRGIESLKIIDIP